MTNPDNLNQLAELLQNASDLNQEEFLELRERLLSDEVLRREVDELLSFDTQIKSTIQEVTTPAGLSDRLNIRLQHELNNSHQHKNAEILEPSSLPFPSENLAETKPNQVNRRKFLTHSALAASVALGVYLWLKPKQQKITIVNHEQLATIGIELAIELSKSTSSTQPNVNNHYPISKHLNLQNLRELGWIEIDNFYSSPSIVYKMRLRDGSFADLFVSKASNFQFSDSFPNSPNPNINLNTANFFSIAWKEADQVFVLVTNRERSLHRVLIQSQPAIT